MQPVELPRLEGARRRRRLEHHLDDGGRQPNHGIYACAPLRVEPLDQHAAVLRQRGRTLPQHAGHDRETLLGRAQRLDHIAKVRRVQVTEERHEAPIAGLGHQHLRLRGFGDGGLGLDGNTGLVHCRKVFAVELEVRRVFPRQHGIGRGARGNEDCARRQLHRFAIAPAAIFAAQLPPHRQARRRAKAINLYRTRVHAFDKGYAFLQRQLHLFVVQRVGRRIDQAFAVGNGGTTPGAQQLHQPGRAFFAFRRGPLPAHCLRVAHELLRYRTFFLLHARQQRRHTHHLGTLQELLDLHQVVGKRLGGRVDGRQAAADDHDRQAHLHIGNRLLLGRSGELQGHQEIACGTHTTRQPVGDVERGRLAGAHGQRHMVEAQRPGVFQRHRATKTHTTEQRKLPPPLQQQAHHLEKVLVPAHRDAVFGHAAKTGHTAFVQRFTQVGIAVYRLEGGARSVQAHARDMLRQGLDLQAIDTHHGVAVVQEVVRQPETCWPHARHQHLVAAGRSRQPAP